MRTNRNIKAIIWDYDGTLADTHRKNMNVTKRIIASIAETDAKIFSIGACYDSGADTSTWDVRPDYEAHTVEHILEIVDHIGRS